ncbi:alpha-1,2-fucosyltransferase [Spirosoma spitsbergense]|uniref:alpha-1,2-fucosyltransferase n=1 Tax=Spirosoma spitsbergense TaxID=431554 RepID=UPI00036E1D08|nr:alpha-1,2-fucosyltransferase [Spirosoma spitsbergense]
MVVVELMGGLGNQMFQYAFGMQLAHQRQDTLTVSTFLLSNKLLANLRNYTYRPFELCIFGIDKPKASPFNLLRALLPFDLNTSLLRETDDPEAVIPAASARIVCVGYWQSEHYFEEVTVHVREKFIFRQPFNSFTSRLANNLNGIPNSVFVHIRRGDYVTNKGANAHHGLCDRTYYERAVTFMREHLENPLFFIFSDDLEWVSQELGPILEPATYVGGNQKNDSWQDMYLMSLCRHAIVANSSFSWWGAWLSPHASKIVVAPKEWFGKPLLPVKTNDLIPNSWIRI